MSKNKKFDIFNQLFKAKCEFNSSLQKIESDSVQNNLTSYE